MALSLVCMCNQDATICTLTALVFTGQCDIQAAPIGASWYFGLYQSSRNQQILVGASVSSTPFSVSLSPLSGWAADWGSMNTCISFDASLFQVPSPPYSEQQNGGCVYSIEQHYQCTNLITGGITTRVVIARDGPAPLAQCITGPGDERSRAFGGGGALQGILYKSTPLGACNGSATCTAGGSWFPPPLPNAIDVDQSGQVCLCASGGQGVLTFSVAEGSLPCGQNLNPETGCIEGSPDGSCPGSPQITFKVTDTGDPGTPPVVTTVSGILNAFGFGVTRIPGGSTSPPMDMGVPFDPSLVGTTITIPVGGVLQDFTIATVTDGDHLTVTTPIGIIAGGVYTYYQTTPGTPPGPPNEATVTCGFIGGGCGTGTATQIGNVSY